MYTPNQQARLVDDHIRELIAEADAHRLAAAARPATRSWVGAVIDRLSVAIGAAAEHRRLHGPRVQDYYASWS